MSDFSTVVWLYWQASCFLTAGCVRAQHEPHKFLNPFRFVWQNISTLTGMWWCYRGCRNQRSQGALHDFSTQKWMLKSWHYISGHLELLMTSLSLFLSGEVVIAHTVLLRDQWSVVFGKIVCVNWQTHTARMQGFPAEYCSAVRWWVIQFNWQSWSNTEEIGVMWKMFWFRED